MKPKIKMLSGLAVFIVGCVILYLLNVWWPNRENVQSLVLSKEIMANQIIQEKDLGVLTVHKSALPPFAEQDMNQIIGKRALVDLPAYASIYSHWLTEDMEVKPSEGEVLLAIPGSSIYSVNTTLRAGDVVNIMFFKTIDQNKQPPRSPQEEIEEVNYQEKINETLTLYDIRVAYTRSAGGNEIMDTQEGQENNRLTSSDRLNSVEIIVPDEVAHTVKDNLEKGYAIWINRKGEK